MNAQSSKREAPRPVLGIEAVCKSFGGIQALNDVSFEVLDGNIHALIGPNGAGKTTLLNLITGSFAADSGRIIFADAPLNGRKPHERVAMGIARTFQNVELFGSMSVLENVLVGRHVKTSCGFIGAMARFPRVAREEREARARALELLDFVGLADAASLRSTDLPFGLQRFLEIARALATGPRVLLLDEPASGLNAVETASLAELLSKVRDSGITLLLVEHDMSLVMKISDRVLVLNNGMVLAAGTTCEVQANEAVISAYLGREQAGEKMLSLSNLKCRYGSVQAVGGIDLAVDTGELVALVGANGAGKSTLLQAVCGFVPDWEGEIIFDGSSLKGMKPSEIVRGGISLVPEGRLLFPPLSVLENLELGAYPRYRRREHKSIAEDLERVLDLFPILRQRTGQPAGTLSGGEQQMLAIGRALMARPRLLLLDEPCTGLAPLLVLLILETLVQLRETGITILLVEQNARAALGIADRGYVIENGLIALEGAASDLLADNSVRQAYLGKECRI